MNDKSKRIFTIPNILSMIRILLIPVFIALYMNGYGLQAGIILVVSGLTDTADGYIARHYDQITNIGKVLDPIADKLTQGVTAICMCIRLQKAIEELTRDKTIIMIAHRLKTVRNADLILVVDDGRIVQQGKHEELIGQKGLYAGSCYRQSVYMI